MTTGNLSEPELPSPPEEKELPIPEYHGDSSKLLIIILCVVLITSLIGTGIFLLSTKQNQPTPLSQLKPIATITPTVTPDQTANWKTYTNEKYGFTFDYPSNWKITYEGYPDPTGNPNRFSLVLNQTLDILITKTGQYKTFDSLSEILNLPSGTAIITSRNKITVNGVDALYVTQNNNQEGLFLLDKNDNLIIFSIDSKNKTILNQILSTFKFTN